MNDFPPYAVGAFIEQVPRGIVADLRAAGYSDQRIERMAPSEIFEAYCTWHGLINWADTLWEVTSALRSIEAQCGATDVAR